MLRTNARGRGQFFEAESEAEDKILASKPACPRGLKITAIRYDSSTSAAGQNISLDRY